MGVVLTFFSRLSFLFSVSLSLGDGPIWTEILSQRAVQSRAINQPTKLSNQRDITVTHLESSENYDVTKLRILRHLKP